MRAQQRRGGEHRINLRRYGACYCRKLNRASNVNGGGKVTRPHVVAFGKVITKQTATTRSSNWAWMLRLRHPFLVTPRQNRGLYIVQRHDSRRWSFSVLFLIIILPSIRHLCSFYIRLWYFLLWFLRCQLIISRHSFAPDFLYNTAYEDRTARRIIDTPETARRWFWIRYRSDSNPRPIGVAAVYRIPEMLECRELFSHLRRFREAQKVRNRCPRLKASQRCPTYKPLVETVRGHQLDRNVLLMFVV